MRFLQFCIVFQVAGLFVGVSGLGRLEYEHIEFLFLFVIEDVGVELLLQYLLFLVVRAGEISEAAQHYIEFFLRLILLIFRYRRVLRGLLEPGLVLLMRRRLDH